MPITGIFTKSHPHIQAIYFDALISESSELSSAASTYPLEDRRVVPDNVAVNPLTVTLKIASSDNWFRSLAAQQGTDLAAPFALGASVTTGAVASLLSGGAAALAGLAAGAGIALAQGDTTSRSQTLLENLRALQQERILIDVVGVKGNYKNCVIIQTAQEVNAANEGAPEITVKLQQFILQESESVRSNEKLPAQDSAATQGQVFVSLGEVMAQ